MSVIIYLSFPGFVESSESILKKILTCIQSLVKISDIKSRSQDGDLENRGNLPHCFSIGRTS